MLSSTTSVSLSYPVGAASPFSRGRRGPVGLPGHWLLCNNTCIEGGSRGRRLLQPESCASLLFVAQQDSCDARSALTLPEGDVIFLAKARYIVRRTRNPKLSPGLSYSPTNKMDGLAALGLASNIVQLVTFTSQLVVSASSIYRSPIGASENNIILSHAASDLSRLIDGIVASDAPCSEDMKQLSLRAKDVAQQVLDILNALIASGKKTRWKSFLVAAKEVTKHDKLTALTDTLSKLQIQMSLHLQTHVR